MEQSFMTFKLLVSYIYCSILVMSMTVSTFDEQVLLDFKSRITDDPFQVMSSWNNSLHYCNWTGITCNPSFQRVMILDLRSLKLVGSIPSSIGNLTFLTTINLRNNSFHGEVPMEIGNLLQLQHLNLTWNSFTGTIPANLSYCKDLRSLALEYNSLVGKVLPDQFSSLSKLNYLGLGSNNLTGGIPSWIGNFSTLRGLSLAINNLQGPIPRDIGSLSNLQIFQVYGNQLNGTIPQSLFNISSVYYFSVTQNLLYGELPSDIGLTLPNLVVFTGAVNDFTGPIPVSLSNATKLGVLELSQNKLTGNVPTSLGKLQGLYRMNFEINSLGRNTSGDLRFLDFLVNCTSLQVLSFEDNILGGELPKTIGNLSMRLQIFALGYNMIVGSLPTGLENLVNLTLLSLDNNYLRGSVPESLGKLRRLQGLLLNGNKLSGRIPSSIGNLTSLSTLHIEDNELEGSIPPELGQCIRLSRLNLTGNKLVGSIPKELAGLSSLSISLALANNSLTGSLPAEFGKLINLKEMDISHNKLSGEIPSTLSSCVSLERFIANNNLFRGEIPESLQGLRGLEEIDFHTITSQEGIPEFLGKLPYLRKLDLSFNELEGEVPTEGIFANETAVSISGNDELCGGPPNYNFPTCPKQKDASSKKHISSRIKVAIIISVAFLFLLLCSFAACYLVIRKSRKRDLTGWSSRERQVLLVISHQCPNIIHHYLAEYGSGVNVSTLGDVYSFGIMLLELCTGRRPTDEIFKDGLNIHQYVKSHLPRRVTEIADASLLLAYEEHNIFEDYASDLEEKAILQDDEYISKLNTSTIIQERLISIIKIGLFCSSSSPRDRMPISIALKEIHTIKNLFLESKRINNSIDRSDGNKLIKLSSSEFY
ncbi:hypothetical protein H5410_039762 [Solanum commersonii]|uniref:non-specific serine/threonine protein kinase n=1 Tax=Solanum commersonii TaxID=4109 RepID=A0A9J5XQ59_SOLCO|nr:hypothetical protein H5410_039762 [Solanum commersonii]